MADPEDLHSSNKISLKEGRRCPLASIRSGSTRQKVSRCTELLSPTSSLILTLPTKITTFFVKVVLDQQDLAKVSNTNPFSNDGLFTSLWDQGLVGSSSSYNRYIKVTPLWLQVNAR